MRRSFTLAAKEKYFFTVGSSDINLILRDCSETIHLESDTFNKGIELSRSDIVEVHSLQNKTMWFYNDSNKPVYVEFQLVEVRIYIKQENINNGEIVVDEVSTPIKIAEIQTPININNLHDVQTIKPLNKSMAVATSVILDDSVYKIDANESRESIIVQAHHSNGSPISVHGFLLVAGGYINLSIQNEIYISGALNSGFNYSEVINAAITN